MQIVINKCYGGFGISKDAMYQLIIRGSEAIQTSSIDEWAEDDREYFIRELTEDIDGSYYHRPHSSTLVDLENEVVYYLDRDDPGVRTDRILLEIIKESAEACNTTHSDLKVVTIPDDVEWEIEEHAGIEWVSEVHRTWG